jgi:hypothetical protein
MIVPVDPFSLATGYELLKIAKREGWLRHAVDFFRPKHRALLLGSTGAGKTQFLRSIPELAAQAISQGARTEFPTVARFDINSKLFEFTDTPGQLEHRLFRDDATKRAIKNDLNGVINFVSYGYHEYGLPVERVFENGVVRSEYLSDHRNREIDLLTEWAPLLSAEWVLTIVTKADIWWDDRTEIADFYLKGAYRQQLAKLFPNARYLVRPYSSISAKFYGTLPGARSFDDEVRRSLRNEVFRLLREATDSYRA